MAIHPTARAALLATVALYASSALATDQKAAHTGGGGPPGVSTLHDDASQERAAAFLKAIAWGDTASAYGMLSDAKRRAMPVDKFNEAIAPLLKAGVADFQVKTRKTSARYFGYDSAIGFFKELHSTVFVGTLLTRHAGSTEMTITVITLGGASRVHDLDFKSLNPDALQAATDTRDFDRRIVELVRAGRKGEASTLAQEALDIFERRLGSAHSLVAQRLDKLGYTLRIQGRFTEAEPHLKRALAMREKIFGKDDPQVCQSLSNLAVLYEMVDRLRDIEPLLKRSLAIWQQAFGPQHPAVGQTLHELSKLYQGQGRAREAQAFYDRAVAILGPAHPAVIMTLIKGGEYEKAVPLLGLPTMPQGDTGAAAAAVRRTFFGQVDNLRWTGLRVDASPKPQLIIIQGEASHRNEIWQPFEVEMVPNGSGWKMRTVRALPMAWK